MRIGFSASRISPGRYHTVRALKQIGIFAICMYANCMCAICMCANCMCAICMCANCAHYLDLALTIEPYVEALLYKTD